ncbi:MAG: transporter substrate-binding domain-containing protein [Myxococcaceae bacterium]
MRSTRASVVHKHWGLLLVLALASPAIGEEKRPEIRAVAAIVPPLVMEEQGHLTGFSIELWEAVAAKLGVRTSYQLVPDAAALLDALSTGQSDIAVVGLYYTTERDRDFDFTYSILNAGLQVMVPSTGQGPKGSPLVAFLKLLLSRSMLYWLVAAVLLLLVPAHVIWFLDRRSADGVAQSDKYFPGIFQVMTWAAEGLLGQAMLMPRHRLAHLFANLWLFTGVVFVAFFTAQMTATLTAEEIRGAINGPDDLAGKVVATPAGSAKYLRAIGAQVQEYTRADELFSALLSGKVQAVVAAAPPLRYFAAHDGLGKVRLVGPEFRKEDLMFVVPLNSPLRRRVNAALVALHDEGNYQRLYEKWFGKE